MPDIEEEIKEVAGKAAREEIANLPPIKVQLPELQNVRVTNPPEIPKVDFSGVIKAIKDLKIPKADTSRVETLLHRVINKEQPDNTDILESILEAVSKNKPIPIDFTDLSDEFRELVGEVKRISDRPIQVSGGGAIGPSKIIIKELVSRINSPQVFEDTSFVSGDSPVTLDVNAALGRNATEFSIQNDGAGDFTVALNHIPGGSFGDEKTVKDGEVYAIDRIIVDSIRITHVADSAYRVTVL